jgi:PKD repeat protein
MRYVLWDDVHDGDGDSLTLNYLSLYQLLSSSGFVVDELTSGTINSGVLAPYDILVLIDPEYDFSSSEISDIHDWVTSGGALIAIPDAGYPPTLNTIMAPYGVQLTGLDTGYGTTTNIAAHPITQDVGSIYYDRAWQLAVSSPSEALAWTLEYYAFLSATTGGEVVVISDSNIMDNDGLGMADNTHLMLNIFNWIGVRYEHELTVTLQTPTFLEPGESTLLNATVRNRGLSNETDVELQLLINGSIVDSVVIPELLTASSYTLSYMWTPTVEATYNVTAYAPPVTGEALTTNNAVSSIVRVCITVEILYDESHDNRNFLDPSDPINHGDAWGYTTWAKIVTEAGYRITKWLPGDGELTLPVLSHYDILVISMARESFTVSEISAIQTWVHSGGSLFLVGEADNYGGDPARLNPVITEFGMEFDLYGEIYEYVISDLAVHPITGGLPQYEVACCGVLILSPTAQWLGRDSTGRVTLACSKYGSGRVVVAADTNTFADNYGFQDPLSPIYEHSRILSLNILDWLHLPPLPPVASFTWTPSIPKVGESVTFDASASTPNGGTMLKYEWDFGDDGTATGQIATHAYANLGTYTVTLNVTDSEGLWDVEQKQIQVVQPHGPEAEFTWTPASPRTDESIKFDASASLPGWNGTHGMPITEYRWDFGDANTTTTSTLIVYHSYKTVGNYYVTLIVYSPGTTPETDAITYRVTVVSVPVGGYSIPLQVQTKAEPVLPHIALIAILTAIFTKLRPKAKRKR